MYKGNQCATFSNAVAYETNVRYFNVLGSFLKTLNVKLFEYCLSLSSETYQPMITLPTTIGTTRGEQFVKTLHPKF